MLLFAVAQGAVEAGELDIRLLALLACRLDGDAGLRDLVLDGLEGGLCLNVLGPGALQALAGLCEPLAALVDGLAQLGEARDHVAALLLEQQHAAVELGEDHLAATALLGEVAHEQALLLEQALELLELALALVEAVSDQLHAGVRLALSELEGLPLALEPAQVVHGQREVELLELAGELLVLLGAAGLALEGLELAVDLCGDVVDAFELCVHVTELLGSALLALLVLEDARSLLHQHAAVLRARLQQRLQGALGDDGVGVAAQAGIVEDVEDVHQAAGAAVDEVLAVAAAVHAAGDDDLVEVERERAVAVVEHEVDFGQAHSLAGAAAGEDDVFHRLAAQLLGALLAEHPQHGVADVRLARAVGAHDNGHPRLELEHGAVCEGLEPLED